MINRYIFFLFGRIFIGMSRSSYVISNARQEVEILISFT